MGVTAGVEVMEEKGPEWVILAPGPGVMAAVSSWAREPPGPRGPAEAGSAGDG